MVLGRVMNIPKGGKEVLVGDFIGVVGDLEDFCVSGLVGADLFVGGVLGVSAHVADGGFYDAFFGVVGGLDAPEAASTEGCELFSHRYLCLW